MSYQRPDVFNESVLNFLARDRRRLSGAADNRSVFDVSGPSAT